MKWVSHYIGHLRYWLGDLGECKRDLLIFISEHEHSQVCRVYRHTLVILTFGTLRLEVYPEF